MMQAMQAELTDHISYLPERKISSIYFGGGTPSLVPERHIHDLIDSVYRLYEVEDNAEITLEVNPDDVTRDKALQWRRAGVNRLSVGVQSFHDDNLKWMNRAHNAAEAMESLRIIRETGFTSFNIDLIFGVPGLSDEDWRKNLQLALDAGADHLSCYALTVEEKTALAVMIRKNKESEPLEKDAATQFMLAHDFLTTHGFEHYELSNYGKDGHQAKHNSAYWGGSPYLGIGPSAHSYNRTGRRWNIASNGLYITAIESGQIYSEEEVLNEKDRLNEYLMTGLRTAQGIDLSLVGKRFGESVSRQLKAQLEDPEWDKMIIRSDKVYSMTPNGWLWSDRLIGELFVV